jgi:type I restriction enzyme S subunit
VTKSPMTKLGDVAQFVRGINFKPDDVVSLCSHDAIACMRTKNVQLELDLEDVWAIDKSFVKRDDQFLKTGDILVSSANSWNLVGKCCWIPELPWPATFGGFVSVLRPYTEIIDPRFLFRWFSSSRIQTVLRSFGQQTTNISNLNAARCLNLDIQLPSLAEQRRIAAILDKADELRAKQRSALTDIDMLIKSIFIEIFGDPVINNQDLPMKSLGELGEWQSGGTPPRDREDYFHGSVPWFSSGELNEMVIGESREQISERALKETSAKSVPEGALMLGMYDTAALKASIAGVRCSCNQAIAFAQINRELAETLYVYFAILIGRDHFRRLQRGVRQKNLNLSMICELRIPVPKLELQRKFVRRIESIEKLKLKLKASLAELNALFVALQHRAFRGEM